MRYIELHLRDEAPAVGSGVRRFIDLTGPKQKQLVLFYLPTLTQIKLDPRLGATAREIKLNKGEARRLRVRLRQIARERKRLGLRVPTAQVAAALAALDTAV